ncbi:hypothetical protein KKC74_10555 [bacterium]|nr:hypothetical protein [bacterium]
MLLLPLYHKIRVPFQCIYEHMFTLNNLIHYVVENNPTLKCFVFEWDIFLIEVTKYKKYINDSIPILLDVSKNILIGSLPRFIWIARARNEDNHIIDLLFDATDIELNSLFITDVAFEKKQVVGFKKLCKTILNNFSDLLLSEPIYQLLKQLCKE